MNNKRRAVLRQALQHLSAASEMVTRIADEEQDALDNMPENLQASDRCEQMENAVANLESASEVIDSAMECIETVLA